MASVNPFTPVTKSVATAGKTSSFTASSDIPDKWARRIEDMDISRLVAFTNHPFKVQDDTAMDQLVASIQADGIHTPLLVRPVGSDGKCEIISGHRRAHAAQRLGYATVPVIVVRVDDDTATLMMVDANLNRPKLLISESAKAMTARYDAKKHQGVKNGTGEGTTAEKLATQYHMSEVTVRRLVSLGRLPDCILDLVDAKKIAEKVARSLTGLSGPQLDMIATTVRENPHVKLTTTMAGKLHDLAGEYPVLTRALIEPVITTLEDTPVSDTITVTIPRRLLPDSSMSVLHASQFITTVLTAFQKSQGKE